MDRLLRVTLLTFILLGMAAAFPAPRSTGAAAPEPDDHGHTAEPGWYVRAMGPREARMGHTRMGHTAVPTVEGSAPAVAAV